MRKLLPMVLPLGPFHMPMLALAILSSFVVPPVTHPAAPQDRFDRGVALPGALEAPLYVEAEDLDGDGHADLLFGGSQSPYHSLEDRSKVLQVSWNDGTGAFTVPESITSSPFSLIGLDSADLDGDGDRDLVLCTRQRGLEIWTNQGARHFERTGTMSLLIAAGLTSLEIVDVDQDGVLDIVLFSGAGDGQFGIRGGDWVRRDSTGQLHPPESLITSDSRTARTRLADLDSDGDLDVVVSGLLSTQPALSYRLAWYENTGGFPIDAATARPLFGNTFGNQDFTVSDVDGDGDLDMIAMSNFAGLSRIRIARNQGDGTFAGGVHIVIPSRESQLQAADINGDGAPDIVTVNEMLPGELGTHYYLNDGTGTFGARQRVGSRPLLTATVAFADLDGDALVETIETVTASPSSGYEASSHSARAYRNLTASGGTGLDRFSRPFDVSESLGEGPVLVADFNQDGRDDLVVHRTLTQPYVAVKLNDGDGRFLQGKKLGDIAELTDTLQAGAAVGDVNGDGFLDVTFIQPTGGSIAAAYGNGQGQFAPAAGIATWPIDTDFVELHDLDADGDPDLIGTNGAGTQILVGLNDGSGGFGAPVAVGLPSLESMRFDVEDFDQDGNVDVLVVFGDRVERALGLGGGQFSARTLMAQLPWVSGGSAIGDFNGDGELDLFVVEKDGTIFPLNPELATLLGGSNGTLGAPQVQVQTARTWDTIRAVDADNDGDDDLLVFSGFNDFNYATYLSSNGDGTFQSPQDLDLGFRRVRGLAVLDVELDGDLDVVVAAGDAAEILIARNETLSQFGLNYCGVGVPNSTGVIGGLGAYGGAEVFQQELELTATQLPLNATGLFLTSRQPDLLFDVTGSVGTLCLGGEIGRFAGPGEIQNSGTEGQFQLDLDLTAMPRPMGTASVMPGQTWYFQAWHRDVNSAGQPTSNFTDALELTFR